MASALQHPIQRRSRVRVPRGRARISEAVWLTTQHGEGVGAARRLLHRPRFLCAPFGVTRSSASCGGADR